MLWTAVLAMLHHFYSTYHLLLNCFSTRLSLSSSVFVCTFSPTQRQFLKFSDCNNHPQLSLAQVIVTSTPTTEADVHTSELKCQPASGVSSAASALGYLLPSAVYLENFSGSEISEKNYLFY